MAEQAEMVTAIAYAAGPKTCPNFSNTEKNPKYSDDFSRGIMRANSDRLSAWLPPWTVPTRNAGRAASWSGRSRRLPGWRR